MTISPEEDSGLDPNALRRGLENFYKFNREITVSQSLVFLFMASRNVCTQKDVQKYLNMTGATASRIVNVWGVKGVTKGKQHIPGYNFFDEYEDVHDRRYKILKLNRAGQLFYRYVLSLDHSWIQEEYDACQTKDQH